MDVTILEATNVPPKPVMALCMGSVRRQVKMEVNRTFQVPHPDGDVDTSVQMTLFQQIASQALLMDEGRKESICCMKVPGVNGEAGTSEVRLRIRHYDASDGQAPERDQVEDAREYLTKHQLQQRIQNLIQDVLKAQPDDPYRFMLQSLKNFQEAKNLPRQPSKGQVSRTSDPEKKPAPAKPAAPAPTLPLAVAETQAPLPPPSAEPEAKAEAPVPTPLEGPTTTDPPKRVLEEAPPALEESPPMLVPRPPEGPRPMDSPSRARKSLSRELAATPDLLEAPPAQAKPTARSEARSAARASIGMLFGGRMVQEQALLSVRDEVRAKTARETAARIVTACKDQFMAQVKNGQCPRNQARASILVMLHKAAPRCTGEYQRAVAAWATAGLIRGAANCIMNGDAERKKDCFLESASFSMPKLIVSLDSSGGGSWGAWCLESAGSTALKDKLQGKSPAKLK